MKLIIVLLIGILIGCVSMRIIMPTSPPVETVGLMDSIQSYADTMERSGYYKGYDDGYDYCKDWLQLEWEPEDSNALYILNGETEFYTLWVLDPDYPNYNESIEYTCKRIGCY